jgi:hypothetical protein
MCFSVRPYYPADDFKDEQGLIVQKLVSSKGTALLRRAVDVPFSLNLQALYLTEYLLSEFLV